MQSVITREEEEAWMREDAVEVSERVEIDTLVRVREDDSRREKR